MQAYFVPLYWLDVPKRPSPSARPYVASDQSISSYIAPKQAETNITYRHEANGQAGDGQARYDQMQVEFYAGGIYPQAEEPYLVQFVTGRKTPRCMIRSPKPTRTTVTVMTLPHRPTTCCITG